MRGFLLPETSSGGAVEIGPHFSILNAQQALPWQAVLNQSVQHDFYHLPGYHELEERQGKGRAQLFVYREAEYTVALPLLLQPIAVVPGLSHFGGSWQDATSVYGYAGPIASHRVVPPSVLGNFQSAVRTALQELGVVSVFSRLHPLIPQLSLLTGLGDCPHNGQTVSLDLTLPPDVQYGGYRKNLKYDINKLKRSGMTCLHDQQLRYLGEFIAIYHATMQRVNASAPYFFDTQYFEELMSARQPEVHLFVTLLDGQVTAGGLFAVCDGIVQYHLSGTHSSYVPLAPTKLMLDTVRVWATERGLRVFHLGGGLGGHEDSLLQFKAGFSDRRHDFHTWRWSVLPDIYEQLLATKERWNAQQGQQTLAPGYFPAYRSPTGPIEHLSS